MKEFRKDIAGLRALAVLLVIIFHLGVFIKLEPDFSSYALFELLNQYVTAGFLGVDVFFVISGFLMTSIIFNKVLSDNVKPHLAVWNFWKSRAKRIVPALIVAGIFFFIIVVQLFEPNRLAQFAKEIRDALSFISNFRFARDEGYFAQSALEKVWLHTWSLSVEWQFYILYPLILLAAKKFLGIEKTKFVVVFLTLLSIAISLILPMSTKSYYMLHIRAWEMLAGGIVYLYPYKFKDIFKLPLQIVGLILIIVSVVANKEQPIWNLSVPALAVAGCALVLWTNCKNILLDNKVSQYIGNISYSLYIYHWPVLVILSLLGLLNPFAAILIIVSLSVLSYHLIEKRRTYSYKTFAIYALSLGLFIQVSKSYGWEWRFSPQDYDFKYHTVKITAQSWELGYDFLHEENDVRYKDVLLMGDSHGAQYAYSLDKAYSKGIIHSTASSFINFKNLIIAAEKKYIEDYENRILDYVKYRESTLESLKSGSFVVVSQYISAYEDFYNKASSDRNLAVLCFYNGKKCNPDVLSYQDVIYQDISTLAKKYSDLNFILLGDNFKTQKTLKFKVFTLLNMPLSKVYSNFLFDVILNNQSKLGSANSDISRFGEVKFDFTNYDEYNEIYKRVAKENSNVFFLDSNIALCKSNLCKVVDDELNSLFADEHHLTIAGANLVVPHILKLIDEIRSKQLKDRH
ncbi:acyltransferase family protein [Anaerobiospirillum thomasii]|uniref:O-acetyltransferase OatA n=1 Tax=Anaerobiospirillum thomasii TaxID=179995 RepID=A0A2X0V2X2_9GAMM|nr:acyltransferase family protein [Anaerobiospirillum thomasii]SPT68889.1 O-acetyltransferase OatA [Anaerobiospirillum thomasii]